ncbi:Ribonuclease HI [Vitis vinifera]|uniref:Ribonuclease HI n=1 Tax=Vitis vinifera TaxID=29760 RepID=A0A438D0V3_VITVI|nr:Ribonuclease HI [Vitis vinifera]
MSLSDYFMRASEPLTHSDMIIGGLGTTQEAELQRLVQQLQLRDGAPGPSTSVLIAPSSPDRTSLMTLCFPDEIDDHGTFVEISDMGLLHHLTFWGVHYRVAEEIQTASAQESVEDLIVFYDLFDSHVGIVEGASDFVDPPLSFDVLSGFVSRQLCFFSSMDLSIFEYLPVSCDIDLSAPSSPTSQIFDIDDEIAQHDSDDDSSLFRFIPLIREFHLLLIQLLRAYLDVFAWSYEDMPGLDPSIVQHRLPLLPHARPVKQKLRRLHPRWSLQDGKVRVCVDFRDLNKASPKDDFPLPHIDMLVDSTAGHSMLSFMDGFSGYSQILMAPEDMEKTSHISESSDHLFHDMMHRDVEVYVDDMIVKSRGRSDHLAALGERGIEVDPDKIRAILTCLHRGQRERKSQPTVWDDQCQRAFERIREYLLSPPVLAPPTPGRPLLLYLSVSDVALGCMLAQLDDSGKDRAIYYLKVHQREHCRRSLASLPVSDARAIDDDFPDEDVAAVTSLSGWRMYFDGAANHSGYGIGVLLISPHGDHIPRSVRLAFSDRHPATNNIVEYEACILGLETALELGIRQMEVFGDSNLVLRQIQGEWKTRDVKLRPYHAYLELLVGRFDDLRYTHLPRAQNQFADALATLASMMTFPDATEPDDGLPWYHDIYHFLRLGVYPEAATAKDKRALRQLAPIRDCGRHCIDDHLMGCYYVWTRLCRSSDERGSCGSLRTTYGRTYVGRKIMRTGTSG